MAAVTVGEESECGEREEKGKQKHWSPKSNAPKRKTRRADM